MGTAHVATIHWFPVSVDRRQFGFGTFDFPAVPLGDKPFVLVVTDKIQKDRGPYGESQDRRKRSIRTFPETGEVIANDIVQSLTQNGNFMRYGCHPGVWRVRESMPLLYETDIFELSHLTHKAGEQQVDAEGGALWRQATPEEYAKMWAEDEDFARKSDAAYAEQVIAYANGVKEEFWVKIPPLPRMAAKHYGITTPWNSKAGVLERIPCPWCSEQIIKGAAYCKSCSRVVDPIKAAEIEMQHNTAAELLAERKRNAELKSKREPAAA